MVNYMTNQSPNRKRKNEGVKGYVFKTQTGEISVHAKELTLLSKSLKPLPIVKYKDGVAYDKFEDP